MQTYLFYDIETTGLNKCFDQVLQFAAIRTTLELKEIDRHEIKIKLHADTIPAPEAIMTHQIGIDAMQTGVTEIEGIQQIHQLMNTPGTISLGYNTLNFDDEFLRFSFYRNLLPAYTHQFANQCGRMDIYPTTVLYYLFKSETLNWPTINGKVSLKLENINQANQLASGAAHDAMVDVEATLALARRLFTQKDMWNYVKGHFEKNTDLDRMRQLPFTLKAGDIQCQEALMINPSIGFTQHFQAPVISLGQHYHYTNQTLWLRLDDPLLIESKPESLFATRIRAAEQIILLPPHARFLKHLSAERKILTDKNRQYLQKNPDFLKAICHYHQNYQYPIIDGIDPQAQLYDLGFPSSEEEKRYKKFHHSKPQSKEQIAEGFSDPIRRQLAMRLLARNYYEHLSDDNRSSYLQFLQAICSENNTPIDYRGEKHLTPSAVQSRINELRKQALNHQQQDLLNSLEKYLADFPTFKMPISN